MAQGAFWVLVEKVGKQVLDLAAFVVVARMIGPEEFGLAGLCIVFSVFSTFVLYGAADGVISLKLSDDRSLSTLFWTVLIAGAILSMGTYWSAGAFGEFMGSERLTGLLKWLAVVPFLNGIASVPTLLIQGRMEFRIFAIRSLVSTLIGGALGIYLALKGHGAYALIYRQIAQLIIVNIVIWHGVRWIPRFVFNRADLSTLLAPGVKMITSTLITFAEQQIPRIFIGGVLGVVQVGYFSLGSRIFLSIREVLIQPVAMVLFPAITSIKEDSEDVKTMLGQIIMLTSLLIFPAIVGTVVTTPQFIPLFFGDNWNPMIPFFQVWMLAMIPVPFLLIIRELLRAHHKTLLFVKIQIVTVGLGLCVGYGLVGRGLVPMAFGLLGTALATFPPALLMLKRSTGFNLGRDFLRIWPPVIGSCAMAVAVIWLDGSGLLSDSPALKLLTSVILGAVVYIGFCAGIQFRQLKTILRDLFLLVKRARANQRG